MMAPPRPAPSADGWSSGENQYDVYGQQQHHQQDFLASQQNAFAGGQAAFNPQWNVGASEFIPKYEIFRSSKTISNFQWLI